ncbi:MAG: purine-nucleoside phosphorylase [Nocardioidaceae bacterium]|nr:purine-nucleoside phosphorylase [Nocardioidaceae bacterium]NUS50300.1 purine-nucleoside phosphorylase [Nocardioidaceae bacterium]
MDPYAAAARAAARIAELTGRDRHDVLVVLGSGWAPAADAFGDPRAAFAMTDVPGFLAPTAEGHVGEIRSYVVGGVAVLAYLGRTHVYEGHGLRPVVHGVRAAHEAGVGTVVLTNANGSLRDDWELGRPVLVADHLNLAGSSPLQGARFVDLTDAWSPRLRALARSVDPSLAEGVYAWLPGPHYETRAEAGWLRRAGADLVGMSTVPEVIAAREWRMEVVGISTVTAVEGTGPGIDPSQVVALAEATAATCGPVLAELVTKGASR